VVYAPGMGFVLTALGSVVTRKVKIAFSALESIKLMNQAVHRHDLSDHHWGLLEGHLPGRTGSWGGVAHDMPLRAIVTAAAEADCSQAI